jgi:hypothetical protein
MESVTARLFLSHPIDMLYLNYKVKIMKNSEVQIRIDNEGEDPQFFTISVREGK